MNNISTTAQLVDLLKESSPFDYEELDRTQVRYALYARKSTLSQDRQERSIEDQIKDCFEKVILPKGIKLIQEPIQESYSAKEPDVRPKFRQLINDIKSGKITGVVTWHPDRLSRNMKEAGELIDLLDKGVLKDLLFATSTFENNPTGKMLLGISFVLSKQYSEHLSETILRGNKYAGEEQGKFIGKLKHGYFVTTDQLLYPDGDNFLIIKTAFKMRLEGSTLKEIAEWLNTTGYTVRKLKDNPHGVVWAKQKVASVLSDPIYAGALKFGKTIVDLTEKYDFQPMITVEEFLKINNISSLKSSKIKMSFTAKPKTVRANLIRGMVYCGHCSKPLTSDLGKVKERKDGKINYYRFKCETVGCAFKNKSIRANVIIKFVQSFLEENKFVTHSNYDEYIGTAKKKLKINSQNRESEIRSLTKQISVKTTNYESTKDLLISNPLMAKHYKLDALSNEIDELRVTQSKLITQRGNELKSLPTFKKYLELLDLAPVILAKMNDMKAMDIVIKNFFSNFTVKDNGRGSEQRYEISYKLKEPWDGFLKTNNVIRGRGKQLLLELFE